MQTGRQKRRAELKDRDRAASALGHAVLDTPKKTQYAVANELLNALEVAHSRLDLMLAMEDRDIEVAPPFQSEFKRVIADDKRRRELQAHGAKAAREERLQKREWQIEWARRKERQIQNELGVNSSVDAAKRQSGPASAPTRSEDPHGG